MNEKSANPTSESKLRNLQRRLREAEDTLEAISAGEVDAVVVDNEGGQQIYTLESPDQPFRVFVEQMQEGALTLNGDGTIIYCNRFFADLVGKPLERVRGQPFASLVAEEDGSCFRGLFDAAAHGTVHGECRLRRGKGPDFPVQLAFNPLPPQAIRMYGVVVTDLSERERAKRLEADRLAAEEASSARDQFLAMVSHELRTPLNAVLGWTQLLRQQDDYPQQVLRGLDVIERSAWSQAQLIDDLLDVSRVLAGKLRLDLHPVDLEEAVDAAVGTGQPEAEQKQITIKTVFPEDPLVVRGDADRIQQIIGNLLSNAVKFTPEGGQVRVTLREIHNMAEVAVEDTGVGIPAEYLPHLFELYRQIESSTTRRAGGLGLGLAIVKELTELHGGEVKAESPGADQGATFRVRIPLLQAGSVPMRLSVSENVFQRPNLEGVTLLLVEDNQAAREMLVQALEVTGALVITASNAADAMKVIEQDQGSGVDLLISDIGLPGTDGYELIGRIREAGWSGRKLPAIALTAFAGREDRRKALLAGYQVHLPKPVDQNELLAAIASLAGR